MPDTKGQILLDFTYMSYLEQLRASWVAVVIKNPPANAGDARDVSSVLGSGRSMGGGYGYPL